MSKQRKQIAAVADELDIEIESMTWEPIGRGGEMQGPSGGWLVETKDGCEFQGYNAAEVVADMRRSDRYGWEKKQCERAYRRGVASSAKEKDEEIAFLKESLIAGSIAERLKAVNAVKAAAVIEFLQAVWATTHGAPPMNWNAVMQEIATRAFGGESYRNPWDYVPPAAPVTFAPIPKSERQQFLLPSGMMGNA